MSELANEQKHHKLLEDILKDAKQEADRILAEARLKAQERREQFEKEFANIENESQALLQKKKDDLKKVFLSARAVELKKIVLKAKEQLIKKINSRLEERFAELINSPTYPEILLNWIVEAAIGLGANEAYVNASAKELALLDDELLKKAEAKASQFLKQPIHIYKSDQQALLLQGVVLYTSDGRMAYNNQVRTRLARKQGLIRQMIYMRLLADTEQRR